MALSYTVDSLDAVPEALRGEYTESGGKFVLNVEGAVPKARVDEFRSNNLTLKRQIDEMTAKFDGVDPEAFRTLSAQAQKIAEKKLIEAGKVDELIEARVAAMRGEHKTLLDGITAQRNTAQSQLEGLLIDGALRDAALKAGVRPTAVDDILLRGRQTFKLAEGKATAFEGDKQLYGKDSEPLSVSDWVHGLAERAPHLFDASGGGGSPKGGAAGNAGAKTMTRAQFMAVPHMQQAGVIQSGVKIVD